MLCLICLPHFFSMRIHYALIFLFCLSVMADYRYLSRDFPPRLPVSVFRFAFQKYTLTFFYSIRFLCGRFSTKKKEAFPTYCLSFVALWFYFELSFVFFVLFFFYLVFLQLFLHSLLILSLFYSGPCSFFHNISLFS